MELVIEIDDKVYKHIKEHNGLAYAVEDYLHEVEWAIKNGTPLPKEHGRLIDADVVVDGFEDNYELCIAVNSTPTIIEADEAESEDKE